jgi:predicted nucleotidyltransferase
MSLQIEAAWALHQFLSARGIPYAIIGGIAVQRWGRPRFTQDVDLTVLLPPGQEEPILAELLAAFPGRIPDALAFARRNRVLLLTVPGGASVDLSLGLPGYEEEVMARAVDYDLGDRRLVRMCSAEDLIIHKAVAGRPQDLADIEGVILRQGSRLDVPYIRRWLRIFADLLETDAVLQRFERPWAQFNERRSTA